MADSSFAIEGRRVGESPKSRLCKKYIIIGAVIGGILALVIILIGILVGSSAKEDIMQFSFDMDENTKEEMMSDPNINMVMFHVTSKEYEAWLINDFNQDIQVMKLHTESYTNCFVTALNRTMATEPSKMKLPSADEMSNGTYMQNMTYMTYRSAETPVLDTTFMGQTAKSTCEGMPTYWLFPSCEGSDSVARRPKRFWGFASFIISLAQLGVDIYGVVK